MKYSFIKIVITIWAAYVCCSCDSLFENELPKHDLTAENAIVDEASSETALLGVYSFLGERVFDSYYIADNAVRSGLVTWTTGTYAEALTLLRLAADGLEVRDKWSYAYQMINAANNVIYYVDKLSDSKFWGNRKKEIIAEARFMRAFGHMFLMKYFAYFWDVNSPYGVLIRTEPASLAVNAKARMTMRDSYNQIIEDLDYAIENGPDYTNCFQASKGAAMAFKANLLMIRGEGDDYANAAKLAQDVIDHGGFQMEETFTDVFTKDYSSKEVIFSRFLSSTVYKQADNKSESVKRMFGGPIGYTAYIYMGSGLNKDKRFSQTLQNIIYEAVSEDRKQWVWSKIWREDGNCPVFYMRLAQMYLIKAEGLARSGASVKDVIEELNVLRRRSGNTALTEADCDTEDKLMTAIYKEILCEVCCENDSEWFTVIRFKSTKSGGRKLADFNINYQDDGMLAFPIPMGELQNNPDMEDNPEI